MAAFLLQTAAGNRAAMERETVWDRIGNASFLTLNEKRIAAGYSPTPNGDTATNE